jgi:hypothetical protein
VKESSLLSPLRLTHRLGPAPPGHRPNGGNDWQPEKPLGTGESGKIPEPRAQPPSPHPLILCTLPTPAPAGTTHWNNATLVPLAS